MTQRSPDDPEVLETLVCDVMWEQWARVPVNQLGETAIAMSTVQHLVIPGWAEDLRRYRGLLENLMTVPTAAHRSGAAGGGARIEVP
ncbi:hypothetical protein [Streptomyces sp. NPDC005548]|uniref:hypothetical protein n=1 Tax=Streptomyces sp. NPDC005548 TaxID=3364724 RepID=UPI0036B9EDC0